VFGVVRNRLATPPRPFRDDVRMFDFVGYRALVDACPGCGFQYAIERAEITPWLRADADAFGRESSGDSTKLRFGPAGPRCLVTLEYLCHVRDVLRRPEGAHPPRATRRSIRFSFR